MPSQKNSYDKSVTIFLLVVFIVICLATFLFLQTQGGLYSPYPYRYLAPYAGKVVDADTGEPLAGAVVLAVYYMTRSFVAGQTSYIVDGQETLTDEKGEFRLPKQKKWLRLERGYPEGKLIIFKPGYGLFPKHARSKAVGVDTPLPVSDNPFLYQLPPLTTIKERKENISAARKYNFPIYIEKINEERRLIGVRSVAVKGED